MPAGLTDSQDLSCLLAMLAGDPGARPRDADDETLHLLSAMATVEEQVRAEGFAALEVVLGGYFFESLALGNPVAFDAWRRALVQLGWHRPGAPSPEDAEG